MGILETDTRILSWLNHLLIGKSAILDSAIKVSAVYAVYLILPVGLLVLWFAAPKRREALFLALVSCLFSWFVITKAIVSNIWFRPRPNLGLTGAKELIFHRPDYSFPSDHATALFAVAFSFYLFGWKKAGHWFLALAIFVSIARVAVGVHFPLDIIAGAVSGLLGVLIVRALKPQILRYLFHPAIFIAKKLKLA